MRKRGGPNIAEGSPDAADEKFPWKHAVVFECPSWKDAPEFSKSDEYKDIKQIWERVSELQGIVLEGIIWFTNLKNLKWYDNQFLFSKLER